ncbi:TetR/AcrR family transcriptional regulator [Fodinicola feengrottensis]|uniref:TetR family transcriptional regulator n=1 Tax=Fodinicola feengrottensis TaxID=435914 RepID=A0ABN2GQC9_9ACTN|nr:TetR/AcrR family transcriptional regulator [Fodinicola feengrottensis]
MERRTELAQGALSYVLDQGLVGLSLRPLAAALGTSDRMLIYHFGSKENLIAEVLALANQEMVRNFDAPDLHIPSVPELVRYAWERLKDPGTAGTTGLYLELCVLSIREPGRWAAAHQRLRAPWLELLRTALTELGVPDARVPVLADLILDALDGLLLDRMVSPDATHADAAAAAFADLLE